MGDEREKLLAEANEHRFTVGPDMGVCAADGVLDIPLGEVLRAEADLVQRLAAALRAVPPVETNADTEKLPTEPGMYRAQGGGRWELDTDAQWWFRGYADREHPTPDQQDRTEFDVRAYGMPLVREVDTAALGDLRARIGALVYGDNNHPQRDLSLVTKIMAQFAAVETVNTVEELDALPVGSVILSFDPDEPESPSVACRAVRGWQFLGDDYPERRYASSALLPTRWTVYVVHRPDTEGSGQ